MPLAEALGLRQRLRGRAAGTPGRAARRVRLPELLELNRPQNPGPGLGARARGPGVEVLWKRASSGRSPGAAHAAVAAGGAGAPRAGGLTSLVPPAAGGPEPVVGPSVRRWPCPWGR